MSRDEIASRVGRWRWLHGPQSLPGFGAAAVRAQLVGKCPSGRRRSRRAPSRREGVAGTSQLARSSVGRDGGVVGCVLGKTNPVIDKCPETESNHEHPTARHRLVHRLRSPGSASKLRVSSTCAVVQCVSSSDMKTPAGTLFRSEVRCSYRVVEKIPRSHAQASFIAVPAFSTMPTQNMKP